MTKGHQGYIHYTKKKNLVFGLTGIGAMFIIYMIGLMISGTNSSFGTLLAVLVALPSAQMLTRYFSLGKYRSTSKLIVEQLSELDQVTALYELVVVQGKVNTFIEAAIITNTRLLILDPLGTIDGKVIQKMLYHKGIQVEVAVFETVDDLKSNVELLESMHIEEQSAVAEKLLENSL